jgi:hypothetical protein
MRIYTIDPSLLDQGRAVYEAGRSCDGMTGLAAIPGAIAAAISDGLAARYQIVQAVSYYVRCRRSTVEAVLDGLETNSAPNGLWCRGEDGTYRLTNLLVRPFTMIAA